MQNEDKEARRPKAGIRESQAQYEPNVLLSKCVERYLLHLPAYSILLSAFASLFFLHPDLLCVFTAQGILTKSSQDCLNTEIYYGRLEV